MFHVTHFNMTEGRQQWNQAVMALDPMDGLVTTKFDTHLSTLARGYGAGPELALHWTLDGAPLADTKSARSPSSTPPATPVLLPLTPGELRTGGTARRHRHPRRRPGQRRR